MTRHPFGIITLIIGLSLALVDPALAQAETGTDIPTETLVLGLVVLPLLLMMNKLIATFWVKRGMYGSSAVEQRELPARMDQPEQAAGRELEFAEIDAATELGDVVAYREAVVERAAASLSLRWRIAAGGAVACALLPWAAASLLGETTDDGPWMVGAFSLIYLVLATLSRGVNRAELYAHGHIGPALPSAWDVLLDWFLKLWMKPGFNLLGWLILAWLLTAGTAPDADANGTGPIFRYTLYLVLAALAALFLYELWKPVETPNIKLLVLRVFGEARGARYTFERLIAPWRFIGVHFTVDDPKFASYRYRVFQRRSLAILVLIVAAGGINPWGGAIALGVVILWDWWGLYQRRPVHTGEEARERIERTIARPRNLQGLFKDTRMVCYMNTWRLVVEQFIDHADVVLFDLREFDEEKAGSTYEINFLFDVFPLDSILFLCDENSDREAIYKVIREQWVALREGSPNIGTKDPTVQVYVSREEDAGDVQGLLDALIAVARHDA